MDELTRAGCVSIFQEKVSGIRTSSPALDELLAAVREGDVALVNCLARWGRNTGHTIQLVDEFNCRGVHFRALDLGIDSRTPAGKMVIDVFSSYNQYERENNREKSLAGIKLAKQQGKHLGRSAGQDVEKLAKVAKALGKGLSVAEIVTLIVISRAIGKRFLSDALFRVLLNKEKATEPVANNSLVVQPVLKGQCAAGADN